MRGRYKAAFILPNDTNKLLTDCGWEFDSENFVPKNIERFLTETLCLDFLEESHGAVYYRGDAIEASIEKNENNQKIQHVYFQVYHDQMLKLKSAFKNSLFENVELFIPSEKN